MIVKIRYEPEELKLLRCLQCRMKLTSKDQQLLLKQNSSFRLNFSAVYMGFPKLNSSIQSH